jgi:gliding motility-associated-like protein
MQKVILILLLLLTANSAVKASHIVGGDIYYDYLGNNQYRFYITVYRDCNSTGAQFDNPLPLGVFLTQNNQLIQTVNVPAPSSVLLPVIFNNPCVVPPNNICVQRAIYITTVTLPPTPGGYTIVYQRCCRGPAINNLVSPDDTGFTLVATIPGNATNNWVNSSPRFTNYPPLLLCNNDQLVFDHSATDPDGDELVYSLVTPNSGATPNNPAPNPPPPPPYFPVQWAGGFNAVNPLGPGASITIDPTTGLLIADPNLIGTFVVGVRVQEYRNGVLIGQTVRDFLFKVFNCNITMQAILPTQQQLPGFVNFCQGLNVQFVNNSYGGTNYAWDFGVPGITTDVSTAFAPSYTYPSPGNYTAMLVVNPGWPCTDTAYIDITVSNPFDVSFTSNDSLCILNNSFNFTGITNAPAGSTFEWNFGPNTTTPSASTQNVNGVSFTSTGNIPVSFNVSNGFCTNSANGSVYIHPEPIAGIVLPIGYECEGLSLNFGNNSQNTSLYQWDFGVPGTDTDVSTAFAPGFTFPQGGTYTVTLIAGTNSSCFDTTTAQVTVNELLSVSFTHNDSLCITDNSFNFDATVTGPSHVEYLWNFGSTATPSTSTDLDVTGVVFSNFGSYSVSLTASFDNCAQTATSTVFIFREPVVNFSVQPGPHCAPTIVQFTDLSLSDSPLNYSWTFGDGASSTIQSPAHLYTNPGSYSVGLGITSTYGCVANLYMLQQDAVVIHPSPESSFMVNPEQTDICNAEITFTDQSSGATSLFYWFDDSTRFADNADIIHVHNYQTSGWHRPMQVAINQFGCRDTSYQELYIEPFIIFIPNTFTPDGNEFNNDFYAKFALEIIEWDFKVYNRWGQVVFETTDPQDAWDGVYLSEIGLVQEGTYAYVLRYVSCELPDSWQLLTGHVNVLR